MSKIPLELTNKLDKTIHDKAMKEMQSMVDNGSIPHIDLASYLTGICTFAKIIQRDEPELLESYVAHILNRLKIVKNIIKGIKDGSM